MRALHNNSLAQDLLARFSDRGGRMKIVPVTGKFSKSGRLYSIVGTWTDGSEFVVVDGRGNTKQATIDVMMRVIHETTSVNEIEVLTIHSDERVEATPQVFLDLE